jgi:predicted DNA-binding protein YlxM (UPF0122 family)
MEKDFRYITLFEIYQGLLTKKQKDIFSAYYMLDLSLSEIADSDGGSRQSVHDAIKKVKLKLDEYEDNLKIYQKNKEVLDCLSETGDTVLYDKIKEILGR